MIGKNILHYKNIEKPGSPLKILKLKMSEVIIQKISHREMAISGKF